MGRDDMSSKRGRGRPRKQNLAPKEICNVPVIELTSSSDEDEAPPRPPPPRKLPIKQTSTKPPILSKKVMKPATRPAINAYNPKIVTPEKVRSKKLTDTEALLSILESNDEDTFNGLSSWKSKDAEESTEKSAERTKDSLLESIEKELRFLDQGDQSETNQKSSLDRNYAPENIEPTSDSKESPKTYTRIKRDSAEAGDLAKTSGGQLKKFRNDSASEFKSSNNFLKKEGKSNGSFFSESNLQRSKENKSVKFGMKSDDRNLKSDDSKKEDFKTKVFGSSDIKLPPEVLEAIRKRTDLGRIEKIVEKTDGNKKSKYIVIFNRSSNFSKEKSAVDEEIEQLLKSLPSKPSTPLKKSLPFDDKEVNRSKITKSSKPLVKPPLKTSVKVNSSKSSSQHLEGGALFTRDETTKRTLDSFVGYEPRFPSAPTDGDGFDSYFKTTVRLVEHHDSLESDSDFDDTDVFSHFKEPHSGPDDGKLNVVNVADSISREFPEWTVQSLPGTDTICLVRLIVDSRGTVTLRKQIRIDSDYNVQVIVNSLSIPEYEGMYDSFDNIKQLVREIDQL